MNPDDERSASARAVRCIHAERCGGCPLIGLDPTAQLETKAARVREALARYPALASVGVRPVRSAATVEGYRTRAKLAVGAGGAIGLYAPDHAVEDIPECRVLPEVMRRALGRLRAVAASSTAPAALRAVDDGGALRAVDLRAVREPARRGPGRDGLLITLVLARGRASRNDAGAACVRLVTAGLATSCAVSWHDGRSPRLLGTAPEVLTGPRSVRDEAGGDEGWVLAAPGSFAQAHRETAAAVRAHVRDAIGAAAPAGRAPRVLELFAGAGALGLSLARGGASVTMVESFAPAAAAAREAARAQGIVGVRAIAGDATRFVRDSVRRGAAFDAVVLDPPRRGVGREALGAVVALGPAVIVYVSCDPGTLARDLATLAAAGYVATEAVQPFDMIPLTDEVETVAVLRRAADGAGAPEPVAVVHRGERLVVCDGGAGVAARAVRLARVRLGWPECIAVAGAAGDESGLVALARTPADAAAIARTCLVRDVAAEAWVKSVPRARGAIARPVPHARRARTTYSRLAVVGGHCRVLVHLERGDTRSARALLASIGHPVLGDDEHGDGPTNAFARERLGLDRPALHVSSLVVADAGAPLELTAGPSGDLALLEARLATR